MRELFENTPPDDPIEAARRSMRTVLPRRFYATAATAAVADGYAVRLDGKPVRTPARRRAGGADAGAGRGHRRRMAGATGRHRSGKNAADAPCQRDHRRRRRRAAAGRRRDRQISGVRSRVLSRRLAAGPRRAPGAPLGSDPRLGARRRSAPISSWARGSSMSRSPRPRLPPRAPRSRRIRGGSAPCTSSRR